MQNVVRAGSLQGYPELLKQLGQEPETVLHACGLSLNILANPDHYVPYTDVIRAIEYPATHLGIRDFGLKLGACQNLDFLGALSLAIQSAATVRESYEVVAQYLRFHTPGASIEVRLDDTPAEERISFQILLEGLPLTPQVSEHAVIHIIKVAKLISAGSIEPLRICFKHRRVGSEASYRKLLGQRPQFEADFDGIVLDAAAGRRLQPQSGNPMLLDVTKRFLIGVTPSANASQENQLRAVLQQLMRFRVTTLQDAALALNLHPRTLQRGLKKEGSSFGALRDEIRKELFLEYIQQRQLSLSHITHILGYSDQAVLNRSCMRWYHKTPNALRNELAGSA